jgi:hypothetical protein
MAKILGRVCGVIFGVMIALAFMNALHRYGEFIDRVDRAIELLEKAQ